MEDKYAHVKSIFDWDEELPECEPTVKNPADSLDDLTVEEVFTCPPEDDDSPEDYDFTNLVQHRRNEIRLAKERMGIKEGEIFNVFGDFDTEV